MAEGTTTDNRGEEGSKQARAGLQSLFAGLGGMSEPARPRPVERWNPPFCGDVDMRIDGNGTWFYQGTPIGRQPLVKLFASILRKDPERYVLVTPVERVGIRVEDVPFLAVEMAVIDNAGTRWLNFRTNVDDVTAAGPDHPLRFEGGIIDGLRPYVHVRGDLWARLTRALLYDLVEIGEERPHQGETMFGVMSGGVFFPMARAHDIDRLA